MKEFKRLIHVLSIGKRPPIDYDNVTLYKAEIHILEMIGDHKNITATDIASSIGVTRSAISQIVSKLHSKDLLTKSEKDQNNRQSLLLTSKGKKVLKAHTLREKELIKNINQRLNQLTQDDIQTFSEIVSSVTDFINSNSK